LLHKWQYFYPGPNQGGSQSAARAEVRGPLIAVLNAFGESLLQPDINIFKQNLHGLESLNSKWRLYYKVKQCLILIWDNSVASYFVASMFAERCEKVREQSCDVSVVLQPEFCEGLLGRFLSVLLNSLVNQCHALLSEDITNAIFNMASVDFSAFQTSFLPEFLRSCSELNDNQRSILIRNFTNETVSTSLVEDHVKCPVEILSTSAKIHSGRVLRDF